MSAKEAYPEILREFHRMVLLPHELVTLVLRNLQIDPIWHTVPRFRTHLAQGNPFCVVSVVTETHIPKSNPNEMGSCATCYFIRTA